MSGFQDSRIPDSCPLHSNDDGILESWNPLQGGDCDTGPEIMLFLLVIITPIVYSYIRLTTAGHLGDYDDPCMETNAALLKRRDAPDFAHHRSKTGGCDEPDHLKFNTSKIVCFAIAAGVLLLQDGPESVTGPGILVWLVAVGMMSFAVCVLNYGCTCDDRGF